MTTTLTSNTNVATIPGNTITATRTARDSIKAYPTTLKAERIKLFSLRSNKAMIALTAVVSGFVTWAISTYVTDQVFTVTEVFTSATIFTAVFAAVGGILMFTSEAQHGTLGPTLSAQSSRAVIVAAKTHMAASYGALLGTVGLAGGFVGAYLGPIAMGDTSTIVSTGFWAIIFSSTAAMLGLGVGMIARHSTAAVSGLLVWWLVVENLLSVFLDERFARFLPFVAGNGMLAGDPAEPVSDLALSTMQNAQVFGAYALAALAIGTFLLYKRDTT